MTRRSVLIPIAAFAAAAAAVLPLATGSAQPTPRTLTLTYAKPDTSQFDDVEPRTMKRGQLSIGDRIIGTQNLKSNGKTIGSQHDVATITNRKPAPFSRFTAQITATYHLTDGDLYAVGFVDAAGAGDRYAIVGGTGAYAGVRGNAVGSENGVVITLDS
jgi:hypothetical protein